MAGAIAVAAYNPNMVLSGSKLWGLFDGSQFHITSRRQSIIAKANNRAECSVWELDNGVWLKVGYKRRVQENHPCDMCQRPLQLAGPYGRVEGEWDWVREDFGRKIADPLRLLRFCAGCLAMNQ